VTRRASAARRKSPRTTPRVGVFGLLGSGNSGNEGSMETILAYLRDAHPDAVVDAMCGGWERVRANHGIDAIPLFWYERHDQQRSAVTAGVLKAAGKAIDVLRTASWVRKHDVVIVPGAGVLEATLPTRPWGFPFEMFLLSASGKLFATKVALVSVGANLINKRATRWLSNSTARLAFYRSYRDSGSRDAMQQRGLDTSGDHVFPDLVFGIPTPPYNPGDVQTVGIGVMAYYGGNDDRLRADQIHVDYVEKIIRFTRWLIDNGYKLRLFGGDSKFDEAVVQQILNDLRTYRPDVGPERVVAEPVSSIADLMSEMSMAGTVIATRYHNVISALKLCKPTISLGYSEKFVTLMTDMGLAEFCQFAYSIDVDQLIQQFTEMQSRREQLQRTMIERNAANARGLDEQFALLSDLLFPPAESSSASVEPEPARGSVG